MYKTHKKLAYIDALEDNRKNKTVLRCPGGQYPTMLGNAPRLQLSLDEYNVRISWDLFTFNVNQAKNLVG